MSRAAKVPTTIAECVAQPSAHAQAQVVAPATTHVNEVVGGILNAMTHRATPFIAGRYPFTYGYDFFRSHASDFGHDSRDPRLGSRQSSYVREYADRTGQAFEDIIVALADGYIAEHHIAATTEQKNAALAERRVDSWKSMGLDGPVAAP